MYEGAIKTRRGRRLYGYLIDNCLVITVIGDKLSLYCDVYFIFQIQKMK